MAIVYPTCSLLPKERFDYWQDVVCSTYAPTINRKLTDEPFDGSLEVKIKGGVTFSRIQSRPIEYERGQKDDGSDHYFIALSLCPDAYVSQSGRVSRQRPGDIVLFDSARPYTCTLPTGDDQIVLSVPRTLLQNRIPDVERFLSRTLDNQSPLGSLAKSMLMEIWGAQLQSDSHSERVNTALLDVLSTAFEAAYGSVIEEQSSHRNRQLMRVKEFILANLSQPNLTAETISQAVHISPRTLNRLFAPEGTTINRWLWLQRLSACHDALLNGKFSQVSEVALSFGFTNLSHFSRAFKQAYGITPQQLMRQS
ncbi:AraC family transcriptional regulator [Pseudomonas syringae group genomosp. 3]|nr:AraC family transcriptional regulator [Pseudomonas syringae group genomosp. 3]